MSQSAARNARRNCRRRGHTPKIDAILKAEQGIRGDPARWTEQAAEEAADVVIAALSMLNALAPVAGPPHEVIAARATVVLARQFASAEVKP